MCQSWRKRALPFFFVACVVHQCHSFYGSCFFRFPFFSFFSLFAVFCRAPFAHFARASHELAPTLNLSTLPASHKEKQKPKLEPKLPLEIWRHSPKQIWCGISWSRATLLRATLLTNSSLAGLPLARILAFIFSVFFRFCVGLCQLHNEGSVLFSRIFTTDTKKAQKSQFAARRCAGLRYF